MSDGSRLGLFASRYHDGQERDAARVALTRALQSGKVRRPAACANCGGYCKPNGHHHDYDTPLDVIWLCHSCHRRMHAAINMELKGRRKREVEQLMVSAIIIAKELLPF